MKLLGYTEIIGTVISGVLALLWFDIRAIRKEKDNFSDRFRVQREDDLNIAYETFIKKEDHSILCENAMLRIEKSVALILKNAVSELKQEIRNGNGHRPG